MSPETIAANLGALRHAGSVEGLVLLRGPELLFHDLPSGDRGAGKLAATLQEIALYFEQEKRQPDQLSFGYAEGQLLVLLFGEFRLAIQHREAAEVDSVARAARAFLKDCVMNATVREFAASSGTGG